MLTPHLLGVPKRGDDGGAKGQAASPREGCSMNNQEYVATFNRISALLEQAIIDRLAEIAKANNGTYVASTPVLRRAAWDAFKETADAEPGLTPLMAVDLWAAVMGANDSAFTQALERKAKAGELSFKVSRGSVARVKSMAASYSG
jgi:hypothetical protein